VVPYAFLMTACIYLISSIPAYLWTVEHRHGTTIEPGTNMIRLAFRNLLGTFRAVKKYKEFIKYMIAYLVYNDGIMMLMDFAAIIGATLYGMDQVELIVFVIIIHLSGTFGALIFGLVSDRKNSRDAIATSLLLLIAAVSCLYFIDGIVQFYVVGIAVGFFLTGAQAISRAMVSQLLANWLLLARLRNFMGSFPSPGGHQLSSDLLCLVPFPSVPIIGT